MSQVARYAFWLSTSCRWRVMVVCMRVSAVSRPRILLQLARERTSERAHDHTAKRAKQKTHEFRFVWIYSCNVVHISFLTLFGVRSCNVVFTFSTFQYTFTGPPKRERAIDKHSRIRCSKEKCVQTSAWFVPSVYFAVSFQWNNRLEVCSPSHDQQQQEQQQPNNKKHRRTSIRTTNVLFKLMHDNQVD